jgi:hypothetical protein
MFPRDLFRENIYHVRDVRLFAKGIKTKYGRVISGGRRGATLVENVRITYSDEDSDGLFETATLTTLLATQSTDACDFHLFFAGMGGDQDWEVRPLRSIEFSGGTLTIVLDSWLLIDPEVLSAYPTDDGFTAVDVSTTTHFVATADIYYIYNDTSDASAVFKWEYAAPGCVCSCGGVGCPVCSDTEQDGCLAVRSHDDGLVAPYPATYSSGTWSMAAFDVCRAPDKLELYYYAGDQSNEKLRGISCDPLSDFWAWCILWLAIARLERPPCSCNRLKNFFDYLREDLSMSFQGKAFFSGDDVRVNPFGPHRGEFMAWKKVKHHASRIMPVAVI